MPKKKTNYHVVFGQLVHVAGDLWKRPIELHIFGRNWTTDLMVDIDQKDGVEQNQIRGYQTFEEHTEQVVSNSENAIVDYYRSICNEYRDRYGIVDANDEKVPIVKGKRDVFKLLTLEGVTFPYARQRPTFGILCQCTWEEERGLAVKFEDGKIVDVGFQDIVL